MLYRISLPTVLTKIEDIYEISSPSAINDKFYLVSILLNTLSQMSSSKFQTPDSSSSEAN